MTQTSQFDKLLRKTSATLKDANQPALQTTKQETTKLPNDTSTGRIGSFKGKLRNCYRETFINNPLSTSTIKEHITEYRCIVENSPERRIEVVLVTYPNEIEGIVNCHVIWKFRDSNFQEQVDTASILIGNLNQDMLKTKEEYFNWVMKDLLDYTMIKGTIGDNNDSSKGKYITDILYYDGQYSIGFDSKKAAECQTNRKIAEQQQMLINLIDAHNNEVMKSPDYRGPQK